MRPNRVPTALRERLGSEPTADLVELLDGSSAEWSEHVLNVAAERFDRRLTQEISSLRVEMAQALGRLQADLLKWSFLFWIGQVAVIAGLLAYMLRASSP